MFDGGKLWGFIGKSEVLQLSGKDHIGVMLKYRVFRKVSENLIF